MLSKTLLVLIAAALGFASQAAAQSNNRYYDNMMNGTASNNRSVTQDARSGNTYDTITNSDGSTSTVGINQRTGAMWKSQNQPNGNQSGTGATGNPWQVRGGAYQNGSQPPQ